MLVSANPPLHEIVGSAGEVEAGVEIPLQLHWLLPREQATRQLD